MHTGSAGFEGGLRFIHEADLGDAVDIFQIGVKFKRRQSGLIVVIHLGVIVRVGIATELAYQTLAEPVVVLRRHAGGNA